MPSFLLLCLNLFRVKKADPAEPHAVAEIVGTRAPSRHSRPSSRAASASRPGSRMSGRATPSTQGRRRPSSADGAAGAGGVRRSVYRGAAPPSAYTPPASILNMSGAGPSTSRRTHRMSDASRASGASDAVSEYRAAAVRSVRSRYEAHGPTEHMRLTHELENWKKADETLSGRRKGKRKQSTSHSVTLSVAEDGTRPRTPGFLHATRSRGNGRAPTPIASS